MANATIVSVQLDADRHFVHAAAQVDEGAPTGVVQYEAAIPFDSTFTGMTPAQKKATIQAALKAVRDQFLLNNQATAGIVGQTIVL